MAWQAQSQVKPNHRCFIAVAQDHAQFLINWEGFPRQRVFMIPNGVDTEKFKPDLTRRAWLRQSLNIPEHAQLVGIVAALREEKNHSQFINAAAMCCGLTATRDSLSWRWSDAYRNRTPDLRTLLAAILSLVGHPVGHGRNPGRPGRFCVDQPHEANPFRSLEALSCGIPVVSPNVGSIHETVIDGKTGILTAPGNADETAQAS